MEVADISHSLAASGLRLCGIEEPGTHLPTWGAWVATGCRPDEGRRDVVVTKDDPDFLDSANSAWFRLAEDEGLFDENGEFLLAVPGGPGDKASRMQWARVKLMDSWDIFANRSDADSELFGAEGFPEFVMLSTDGNLVLRATTWGNGSIGLVVLPHPRRMETISRYVERRSANPKTPPHERAEGTNWLSSPA
ncbi:hypothetical protein ACH4U6_26170 [Streptomyces netropsis]|uniref:hypothetical protein n=1 Tax=Streptomyces netropsis TaxID=55404 RepID=UPI0037895E1B